MWPVCGMWGSITEKLGNMGGVLRTSPVLGKGHTCYLINMFDLTPIDLQVMMPTEVTFMGWLGVRVWVVTSLHQASALSLSSFKLKLVKAK